tara:strand:+ start:34040 stop:35044 length:1005 start_codon:yes stop_codon:yes gene_type:complete
MGCVLLTGGFGYIGSHTAPILAEKNIDFVVYDNFCNSKRDVIEKLEIITKRKINYEIGDIRDKEKLIKVIKKYKVVSVIHFAALKSVENSILTPLEYYENNVGGTINLLYAMRITGVKRLLFSSTAAIYGEPEYCPIDENHPLRSLNPYGNTKLIVERILSDIFVNEKDWSILCLRYFNPVGAHPTGLIGDDPLKDKAKNLMPAIIKVANGFNEFVDVFGDDYNTHDGSCIRDYIHIMDLALAHVVSVDFLEKDNIFEVFNIGTGYGVSVFELINKFEEVSGLKVPTKISSRRAGDASCCYADASKAKQILNWEANLDLKDMCLSSWNFAKKIN